MSSQALVGPSTKRRTSRRPLPAGATSSTSWPALLRSAARRPWHGRSSTSSTSLGQIAGGLPLKVDVSKVEPGQQITVLWRKSPIFIVRRTPAMLAELSKPSELKMLRDPQSRSEQQPFYARNWSRSINPEYLVLIGVCTHLGCVPGFTPGVGSLGPSWPGGWLCPCHGSRYDLAGRVFKSVPAPLNLPVPPYVFESPTSLLIGQNPPGQSWSMSEINTL